MCFKIRVGYCFGIQFQKWLISSPNFNLRPKYHRQSNGDVETPLEMTPQKNLNFQKIRHLTSSNSNHLWPSNWPNTHIFPIFQSQIKISPPFSRTRFKTLKNTRSKKIKFSKKINLRISHQILIAQIQEPSCPITSHTPYRHISGSSFPTHRSICLEIDYPWSTVVGENNTKSHHNHFYVVNHLVGYLTDNTWLKNI